MKRSTLFAIFTACGIATALPAIAHPGRTPKDPQCLHDCLSTARSCADAARETFETCRETNCSAAQEAARQACGAESRSEACKEARRALAQCVKPCREAYRTTVHECWTVARECIGQCPQADPKDPECVAACREDVEACKGAARMAAQECRQQCTDEMQAVRRACNRFRPSPRCRAARQALYTCLDPCNEALHEAIEACRAANADCLAACPDADPS